jgi:hypothetical protein
MPCVYVAALHLCGGVHICRYGELAFNLDYYMDVQDLSYLVQHMERSNPRMSKRYSKLTAGLCELVEDFSLVSFAGLNIEDRERWVAPLLAHWE